MLDHMLTAEAMLLGAKMGVLDKLKIVALANEVAKLADLSMVTKTLL